MTAFTAIGWTLAHSLWEGMLIVGATALGLGLLRHARAATRERIATVALALMVLLPIATAVMAPDLLTEAMRRPLAMTVDRAIELPTYLAWRQSVLAAIGVLWTAGALVGLTRLAVAWRRTREWRDSHHQDAGADVRADVASVSRAFGIRAPIDVRRSSRARVPMALGWRRPVILLPVESLALLSREQLRSILAHELAHVRRRDYLVNLWQLAADRLLFHHPAAAWLSRQIRLEREYSCDDAAVAAADRSVYAHALAALEDVRSLCPFAVAAASGTLLDRIERIAGRPRRVLTPAIGGAAFAAAAAVSAVIVAMAMLLPPSMPAGTLLRRRMPPPSGAVTPPGGQPSMPRSTPGR